MNELMKKNNLSIFLCSAIVTAVVTMLFTPKSGRELRNDIKKKTSDTKDSVQRSAENLKQDFKASYFEAAEEIEKERIALGKRQRELNETITAIENDLRGEQ